MKASEAQIGMEVVANDEADATVYTIRDVSGHDVWLTYNTTAGMRVNVGWVDVSILKKKG